ncbi:MAG: ECF-type sigma factor [Thermoanaerobaculia bacterium]|nr:ECF-type sigma factor [Thermoanaerobaculia bacterium]
MQHLRLLSRFETFQGGDVIQVTSEKTERPSTLPVGNVHDPLVPLLERWQGGESGSLDELMPLVVDRFREMARALMVYEASGHTLQPTALVNELYLHLRTRRRVRWQSVEQFLGYCATVLRRVLVDYSRRRFAGKRDRALTVALDALGDVGAVSPPGSPADLLGLQGALETLQRRDPRQAQIVEFRLFLGLTEAEVGSLLHLSTRTVRREWKTARLWLKRALAT